MKRIFQSPDGRLRLLWRLFIYLALFAVVATGANVVAMVSPSDPLILVSRLLFAALYILGALVITRLCRRKVDKKTWSGMGLPSLRKSWPYLAGGFLLYTLIQVQSFGIKYVAGFVRVDGYEASDSGVLMTIIFVSASLIYCIGIGFAEELAFRGYLFQNLGEHFPIWLAILINTLLFSTVHFLGNDFSTVLAALPMLFVSTLIFIILRLSTQSIWTAVGWHIASNWLYFSVFGTLSGGQYGAGHALLHLTETTNFPLWFSFWDNFVFVLVIGLLLFWAWRRGNPVDFRARLEDDGSIGKH